MNLKNTRIGRWITNIKELFDFIVEQIDKEPPRDWMGEREDYLAGKGTRKK